MASVPRAPSASCGASTTNLNPAVAPTDPLEAALPEAKIEASRGLVPVQQRDVRERQATAAQRAAGSLLEAETQDASTAEPATEDATNTTAAEAASLVKGWSEEEQTAVRDAIFDAELERHPAAVDEPEEGDQEWDVTYATNAADGTITSAAALVQDFAQDMTDQQWQDIYQVDYSADEESGGSGEAESE